MSTHVPTNKYQNSLRFAVLLLILLGIAACATTPESATDTAKTDTATDTEKSTTSATTETEQNADKTAGDTTSVDPMAQIIAAAQTEQAEQAPAPQPVETQPVRIDVSCQNEPYGKYEAQARDSISKGLAATTAGTYGVGFRNLEEHKKWSETHSALFTAVNQACAELSECAKQHPKDKTKQCEKQAKTYSDWQNLAAKFTEDAKQVETTQPPKICSFSPSLDDAASCFHSLAEISTNNVIAPIAKKPAIAGAALGFSMV